MSENKRTKRTENYGKVKPVVKERIEDLFMSVNGSPQDFAFRGIVPKEEKRGLIKQHKLCYYINVKREQEQK